MCNKHITREGLILHHVVKRHINLTQSKISWSQTTPIILFILRHDYNARLRNKMLRGQEGLLPLVLAFSSPFKRFQLTMRFSNGSALCKNEKGLSLSKMKIPGSDKIGMPKSVISKRYLPLIQPLFFWIWNNLPVRIRNCNSLTLFTKSLKTHLYQI